MEPLSLTLRAWDDLPLRVRVWDDGDRRTPLLCLPGLVRTAEDFDVIVPFLGEGRRIVSLDYAGRGGSGRSTQVTRYGPEACARDIMDVCAALHLGRAAIIGTSFGGLLAMGLAAARPAMILGVVLNDVGPEIGTDGAAFVRRFVGTDPALPDLDACAAYLKAHLPPLSLHTDDDWRAMAALTYQPGADGRFHPVWDTAIARLLDAPPPDLWGYFGALAHVPVLVVHGAVSTLLSADSVARMAARHPALTHVTVPDIGHAPILTEPPARDALVRFVQRIDAARS
jgi:pimeloyl-ACP methyl ester carboxylesterase